MNTAAYIKGYLQKQAADPDVHVLSAVPQDSLKSVLKHGLLSSKAMLDNPEALKAFLKSREGTDWEETEEAFRARVGDKLKDDFWGTSVQGPSVFFGQPDPGKITDKHPSRKLRTELLKINLSKLMREHPGTRISGTELVPYDPEGPEHQGDRRHKDIGMEDVRGYSAKSPEELWQHYDDPEGTRYAGDVPHAQIITPEGGIPPEYIDLHKQAADPARVPKGFVARRMPSEKERAKSWARKVPGFHRGYLAGPGGVESFRQPEDIDREYNQARSASPEAFREYQRETGGRGQHPRLFETMSRHYAGRPGGYFPRSVEAQHMAAPNVDLAQRMAPLLRSESDQAVNQAAEHLVKYTKNKYPGWSAIPENNRYGPSTPEDFRHSAPVSEEQLQQMSAALPEHHISTVSPERARRSKLMPLENRLVVPQGRAGLPTALHEYTHAVDPFFAEKPEVFDEAYHGLDQNEPEILATATERAAEASPYLPPERRRPFVTPMGKQVERFGPTLRGNFRGDLGNIRDWTRSMRRMPDARLQAKKPFAYHGDTRTPQQRAQALGTAYQNWMNRQAGQ